MEFKQGNISYGYLIIVPCFTDKYFTVFLGGEKVFLQLVVSNRSIDLF